MDKIINAIFGMSRVTRTAKHYAADDAERHSIGIWLDGTKQVLTSQREG